MIEQDTIKLLRECDSGIRMGVSSIDEVLDDVCSEDLKQILTDCKNSHISLGDETEKLLNRYHDEGKEPNPIVKGMSWMKTAVKIAVEKTDKTVADLMTDGCNMGIKSLSRYLNQYAAADEQTKDIAKRLITLESDLCEDLRDYL